MGFWKIVYDYFKPEEPWRYLGYTEVSWYDINDQENQIGWDVIRFYARGENLGQRRVEIGKDKYSPFCANTHSFYHKYVLPWRDSNTNLYPPIHSPSEWLIEYTKERFGYVRFDHFDGKWVKPAPVEKREDNVITLKVKNGDG